VPLKANRECDHELGNAGGGGGRKMQVKNTGGNTGEDGGRVPKKDLIPDRYEGGGNPSEVKSTAPA